MSTGRSSRREEEREGSDGVPRTIGMIGGVSFIVGTVVGSGIFVSPRGVAMYSGSVGMTLVIWTLSGIISLIGALCYAELGTIIKLSGADYAYLDKAYGPLISFQYSWVNNILVRPGQLATICLTMAQYITSLFLHGDCCAGTDTINQFFACFIILTLGAINISSASLANKIQVVFTVAKLAALAVIIVGGVVKLSQGYTEHLTTGFEGSETNIGLLMTAFYSGMWAYDGWNTANFMSEEIINLEKNLPLSIMIGMPLCICLFILTNISYFTVLSVPQMVNSNAVALAWADKVIPCCSWVVPVCVALSCFGTGNGTLFSSGRLMFASARNGHLPDILSMVHVHRYTPSPAIIVNVVCAMVLTFVGSISSLIDLLSFIMWIFYGMNFVAVIIFRFNDYKHLPRPIKVPLLLPIVASVFSLCLVLIPLITSPQAGYFFALAFILLGYIVYVPLVHYRLQAPFMRWWGAYCIS